MQQIAERRGISMAQVALAWVLRSPVVSALEQHYTPRTPTYYE